MGEWREAAGDFLRNMGRLCFELLFAGITGLAVGIPASAFALVMDRLTQLRGAYPWLIFFLPVGGVAIIAMYRGLKVYNPRGTNLVLSAIHSQEELPVAMAPLIAVSTWITHLVGGSAGREGAALQIGGSLGAWLGRVMRFDQKDKNVAVMCGMSAAFAAVFGTPLAAAVFPLEVVSVGIMHYSALVPCMFAAIVASRTALFLGLHPEAFPVGDVPEISVYSVAAVIVLGILCAAVSTAFCILLHKTGSLFHREYFQRHPYIRVCAGAVIILAVFLLLGNQDYAGAGFPMIEKAFAGETGPEAFAVKMVLTAVTLGCGFKGGEIVPSFFVGATFGAYFGSLMGLPTPLCGAVGMAAVFCGVTNCPISTLLISFELFGLEGMLYYLIAVSVSYMASGYYGLYHDQKIIYSKSRTEYINRKTK